MFLFAGCINLCRELWARVAGRCRPHRLCVRALATISSASRSTSRASILDLRRRITLDSFGTCCPEAVRDTQPATDPLDASHSSHLHLPGRRYGKAVRTSKNNSVELFSYPPQTYPTFGSHKRMSELGQWAVCSIVDQNTIVYPIWCFTYTWHPYGLQPSGKPVQPYHGQGTPSRASPGKKYSGIHANDCFRKEGPDFGNPGPSYFV